MKEKLIELIEDTLQDWECDVSDKTISEIAEHLIQNGVIVLPCKVGDTVYAFCEMLGVILEYKVVGIGITEVATQYEAYAYRIEDDVLIDNIDYETDDIGKTVFLSREEAEKELKERERR